MTAFESTTSATGPVESLPFYNCDDVVGQFDSMAATRFIKSPKDREHARLSIGGAFSPSK